MPEMPSPCGASNNHAPPEAPDAPPPQTCSRADAWMCVFCFFIFFNALRVLPCSQFLRLFFSLCNESWKLHLVVGMFQRTQDISVLQAFFSLFALIQSLVKWKLLVSFKS
uniref:Uncharacterized protein n=1 Tax=Mus musculus TaxID=10090 RepID=Q3UVS4_MOUSE|nr:unnamed protein product [Mus musculus]